MEHTTQTQTRSLSSYQLYEDNRLLSERARTYFTRFAWMMLALLALFTSWNAMTFYQIISVLLLIWCVSKGSHLVNLKSQLMLILGFHVVMISFVAILPYDLSSWDGDGYDIFAKGMVMSSNDFFEPYYRMYTGQGGGYDRSDLGYSIVIGILYELFGFDVGPVMLWLVKIGCHLATVVLIYRIMMKWLEPEGAMLVSLVFGLNAYVEYWLFANLKENIFCMITVLAVYWTYMLIERKTLAHFMMFALLVWLTQFFRGSYPYYFIAAILIYEILSRLHSFWANVAMICLVALMFMASVFVSFMDANYLGQLGEADQIFAGNNAIIRYVGPFFAPFPAMKSQGPLTNTVTLPYSVLNMCFALFAFLGMWKTIRLHEKSYYPILCIFLLNSVMVIMMGFSINARFLYPVQPLYYMFIPIGLYYFFKSWILYGYSIFALALTWFYNYR